MHCATNVSNGHGGRDDVQKYISSKMHIEVGKIKKLKQISTLEYFMPSMEDLQATYAEALSSCETFNTVTNQWTFLFDLDTPIACCLPVKVDNYIICIGGYNFDTAENIEKCTVVSIKDRSTRSVPLKFAYMKRYRNFHCIRAVIRKRIFR